MLNAFTATVLTVSMALAPETSLDAGKLSANKKLTQHPTIRRMMELQNQERARYSLAPLKMDRKLCIAAQKHAEWMAETGYYMHSNLPWPEIIDAGPTTPEGAVNDWIWSQSHHGVMLSGNIAGFGFAKASNGTGYWVTVIDSSGADTSARYIAPYSQSETVYYTQGGQTYYQQPATTYYYPTSRRAPGVAGRGFRRGHSFRAR